MTFEEFAQTRLPSLLAFATVLTGQRATAEDVTQEVLIRAHGRWDQIARLDRPELYVRKMVLNEFLSWRRRSWRTFPAANPVPLQELTADHAAGYDEHAAMLAQLGKLPRRQRAVLRCCRGRDDSRGGCYRERADTSPRSSHLRLRPGPPASLLHVTSVDPPVRVSQDVQRSRQGHGYGGDPRHRPSARALRHFRRGGWRCG